MSPISYWLRQNVFIHRHHAILLVLGNQTFPFSSGTAKIIGLCNKMANDTPHGLKSNRI